MIVDSHQHFWALNRNEYVWLTPARAQIYRDFGPDDLQPHLHANDVNLTVLVQAAPSQAETYYLLDVAARTPWVAGVVGWVDLASADAPREIEVLSRNPKLKGLRPMLHDLDDDRWLLRPEVAPAIDAMIANNLRFDALIRPHHLPVLLRFAERHSSLSIVLDHAAKPAIERREWLPWSAHLRELAAAQHVFCKVSGLVTEAGPHWSLSQVGRYVEYLVEVFGAVRLMWGSDWPVVEEAGGYGPWYCAARAMLQGQPAAATAAIFGEVATQFYGLHS